MTIEDRVLIAGAGPVGLVAAANLVRQRRAGDGARGGVGPQRGVARLDVPPADARHARPAGRRTAADRARPGRAAFQYRTRQHGVLAQFDFAAIADVTGHPLPAAVRAVEAHPHPATSSCAAIPLSSCNSAAQVRDVTQHASGVEIAVEREGQHGNAVRPLADRRRRRAQRCAALARHRVRRLHLAGALPGGEHAVRFLHRHSRPGRGELRRRPAALALPAANSRALPRDVSDRGRRKRRAGDEPGIRAVADGAPWCRASRATRSPTSRSTECTSGSRRPSSRAAHSWSATPPTSTIRSAAWG